MNDSLCSGRVLRPILAATLVAGTLDILSAFAFVGMAGVGPVAVLSCVASGPFGGAATPAWGWAAIGLAVHFAIRVRPSHLLRTPRIIDISDP